jgi:transposase
MSRKRKFSDLQRLEAVLDVLEKGFSLCEVARRIGTDHKTVRRWVAFYEQYGAKGLGPFKKINYSGDYKLSVIRCMRENNLSLFEASVKFGIPNESVVFAWDRLYESEGASALYRDNRGKMKKPHKNKQSTRAKSVKSTEDKLLEELEYLRAENAYLKKLRALVEQRVSRESA